MEKDIPNSQPPKPKDIKIRFLGRAMGKDKDAGVPRIIAVLGWGNRMPTEAEIKSLFLPRLSWKAWALMLSTSFVSACIVGYWTEQFIESTKPERVEQAQARLQKLPQYRFAPDKLTPKTTALVQPMIPPLPDAPPPTVRSPLNQDQPVQPTSKA